MMMHVSTPNENGCLEIGHTEVVAQDGHSLAEVQIALSDDGRYRFAIYLSYSYGGFGGPISVDAEGYADFNATVDAGIAELLRRWPKPFASDPQSVASELRREQIESRSRQLLLF